MRLAQLAPLLLAATVAGFALPAHAAITLGPGPARGTDRAGVTWYEEFQDWTHADLKALDPAGPDDAGLYRVNDGFDDSRDLVAFYEREEGANVYFRVDVHDLALGAEPSNLSLYLAIDAAAGGQVFFPDFLDCKTDRPWELCLAIYKSGTNSGTDYRLFDANFNLVTGAYLGAYFNSQLDAIEFGITRQTLIDHGWNGTQPLAFQVFTTKPNFETNCSGGGLSSDILDAMPEDDRGCSDGVLNGAILSTNTAGLVYYTAIAHGNQSVNKANDIGAHIYDSQANTGISGGTGFLRTLDTHRIFGVPLNIHPSGSLTVACQWAHKPGGASDPQDGPSFVNEVRQFVDANQSDRPGSLIGGVFAEHIMPYFEGPVNAASLALTDSINQVAYGISAAAAKVMHVPERVIRSTETGLSPLNGHTFADIAASPYTATYLDEITHLHKWFYLGESCSPDAGYRHKVHKINGVYCFMINDREDQEKFGNDDGGMIKDARLSLLQKALYGNSSEIVTVFDDWEAYAGKSFDPTSGNSLPNNNPNQYNATIRWAANHPWIKISNLKDVLALALASPATFVIDHGTRFDLPLSNYEWLLHATEDSYDNWYYDQSNNVAGNEQDFYHLVPVITGPQGDYHSRGVSPTSDGPPLPSRRILGDLNTPGSLLYESWNALQAAPAGRLRQLGIAGYLSMIFETAWHEENEVDYSNGCYGAWNFPDQSWDGVNTWALRLQNHARQAGIYAAAAAWADSAKRHVLPGVAVTQVRDLDFDGESEYVLRNDRVFAVFERYGGRCVLACAFDALSNEAQVIVGAPLTNPSSPGEEEQTGSAANRCSAFKDMNSGGYADAVYSAVPVANGWQFTSPDLKIVKTITLGAYSYTLNAAYNESVAGPLYVRLGLSPNATDLMFHGQDHLTGTLDGAASKYTLLNSAGGGAVVRFIGLAWSASPSDENSLRRNLALTEQVEVSGDGAFQLALDLVPAAQVVGVPVASQPLRFAVTGPTPSPSRGSARLAIMLPESRSVVWDVVDLSGRRVAAGTLGRMAAGGAQIQLRPTDDRGQALAPGVYLVRVSAGNEHATARWVVVE